MRLRILSSSRGGAARVRKTAGLAFSAALVAGATMAVGDAAGAASSTWASTATQALNMGNATSLGKVSANQPLSISVVLKVRNASTLQRMAKAASTVGSSTYGHFLTPAEVAAKFAPSTSETNAVASWLTSEGFHGVSVESDRLFVDATGTALQAEKAFDTTLGSFSWQGKTVYANTKAAMVPSQFSGEVSSVLGLSDIDLSLPIELHQDNATIPATVQQQIAKVTSLDGTPDIDGFTPEQLAQIYNASSLPEGTSTSIAVLTSGDMKGTIADLRYAEQRTVPQRPLCPSSTPLPRRT